MAANDLLLSTQGGSIKAVTILLDQGVDPNVRDRMGRTSLMYAVIDGHDQLVDLLMSRKADVNAVDRRSWSALHFAAQDYRVDAAQKLLAAGAHVDFQDVHGNSPLSTAVFNARNRGEMILLLLRHGADRNLPNNSGVTPLSLANTIANYDAKQFFK